MSATYDVVTTRTGDWWEIEVTSGLPANVLGVSQARRLAQVPEVARQLIADLLEVDAQQVDVTVHVELVPELQQLIEQYEEATVMEDAARTKAAHARSRSAAALLDARLTMRDAAILLGISHQRVKQLVDRARELDPGGTAEKLAVAGDAQGAPRASVAAARTEPRSHKAEIAQSS